MTELEEFRTKWAESTAIGHTAEAQLGEEKYAIEVLKKPIPDKSTATFAERDRLRAECKDIAAKFCKSNDMTTYAGLAIEHLVNLVDMARHRGDADAVTTIDMFLLANFEPQRIVGNFRAPAPGR